MKTIGLILLGGSALYLVLLVAVTLFQRSLIYFPRTTPLSPAASGLAKAQELKIATADGETLVAWYIPAAEGRPLLLYFHGNAGSLIERLPRFNALTAEGNGLLAISYRGYFGSTGSPSETGLLQDAEAGYSKALSLGYPADRIIIVGESLGSGVAVALAAQKPATALILDSPYTSTVDVAAATFWMFPVRSLMWDQFHSDERIGKVHAPLLIAHGTRDGVVPFRFGEKLFALANEPKRFIAVPGAGHLVLGRPEVMPQVLKWIDERVATAVR